MNCSVCGNESRPINGQRIDTTTCDIVYQCTNMNCFNRVTVTKLAVNLLPAERSVTKKIIRKNNY